MKNSLTNFDLFITDLKEIEGEYDYLYNINVFSSMDSELYSILIQKAIDESKITIYKQVYFNFLPIGYVVKVNNSFSNKFNDKLVFINFLSLRWDKNEKGLEEYFKKMLSYLLPRIPDLKVKDGYEKITIEDMKKGKGNELPTNEQLTMINTFVWYKWRYNLVFKKNNLIEYEVQNQEALDKDWIDRAIDCYIRMTQSQFLGNGNKRTALAYLWIFLFEQKIYIGCEDIFNDIEFVNNFEKLALETATKYRHEFIFNEYGESEINITNEKLTEEEISYNLKTFLLKKARFFI